MVCWKLEVGRDRLGCVPVIRMWLVSANGGNWEVVDSMILWNLFLGNSFRGMNWEIFVCLLEEQ